MEKAVLAAPNNPLLTNNLGQLYKKSGRFDKAIEAYRSALRIDPNFADAHNNLGNALCENDQPQEAIGHYSTAVEIDPKNAYTHYNLGILLKSLGDHSAAIDSLERALAIDPKYPDAEFEIMTSRKQLIQGWHLGMLGDDVRNDAFDQAIRNAVSPNSHVLDIGTGSGLLAMMAARAGAAKVTACEKLSHVARAARQVIEDNGYSDIITVVEKSSEHIRVGIDMERPADVLVSEIIDAGLLGENVLPTMRHVMQHLVMPNAKIIPKSGEIMGALVEMPMRRRTNPLRSISGFDLSAFDIFRGPNQHKVVLNHEDHKFLSDVFPIVRFDFANLPPASDQLSKHHLKVDAIANGTVEAIVVWFDLHLDHENVLSTNPNNETTHWGQGAQFFEEDFPVQNGQSLSIDVTWSDQQISFSVVAD